VHSAVVGSTQAVAVAVGCSNAFGLDASIAGWPEVSIEAPDIAFSSHDYAKGAAARVKGEQRWNSQKKQG
jgi:hypothetical protein